MYDLSTTFGLVDLSTVSSGSSLLVTDHGDVDIERYLFDALQAGLENGEGAIIVTAEKSAQEMVEALERRITIDERAVCVIDCQADRDREQTTLENGVFVTSLPSPDDLTGFGIGLTACFDRLEAAGIERARVGFFALETILAATSEEEIFKFSHVVSSRLASAGFLGVFGLETAATGGVLGEAFDGTVALREAGNGPEGRVTGRLGGGQSWQPLPDHDQL